MKASATMRAKRKGKIGGSEAGKCGGGEREDE
jgi:hypothetical protein